LIELSDLTGESRTQGGTVQEIDWAGIARTPRFQELRRRRFRFMIFAVLLSAGNAFLILLLSAFAPGAMGQIIVDGLSVGLVLAIGQYLLVGVLTFLYVRRSNGSLERLRTEVVRAALATAATEGTATDAAPTRAGDNR